MDIKIWKSLVYIKHLKPKDWPRDPSGSSSRDHSALFASIELFVICLHIPQAMNLVTLIFCWNPYTFLYFPISFNPQTKCYLSQILLLYAPLIF